MNAHIQPAIPEWWAEPPNVVEAALAYHRAGLCPIVLNGKRPALTTWHEYQSERPPAALIGQWKRAGIFGNVGLVCGAVSGGLVVVDFDGPAGYPAFAATFPNLVETFTVATGGGVGKHVYLLADEVPPTTRALNTPLGHVELRSDGSYVVAPPSIHPDTLKPYTIEKPVGILRVRDLRHVVKWIEALDSPVESPRAWKPP